MTAPAFAIVCPCGGRITMRSLAPKARTCRTCGTIYGVIGREVLAKLTNRTVAVVVFDLTYSQSFYETGGSPLNAPPALMRPKKR